MRRPCQRTAAPVPTPLPARTAKNHARRSPITIFLVLASGVPGAGADSGVCGNVATESNCNALVKNDHCTNTSSLYAYMAVNCKQT